MGYTKDTLHGISWLGAFRVTTRILSFFKIIILARLLTPTQFGIFGIALLILNFFETLTQTGVSVYLVQEKKKLSEFVSSAFVLSIARGFIISFLIFISAPAIAKYFGSPESLGLIRLASMISLVRGFINPGRVVYLKNLEFKREFIFSFGVFLVDSIISITLVFLLRSPSALLWGLLGGALFEAIMSHILISPKPSLSYDWNQIRAMMKKGKWYAGFSVSSYLLEQGDDIVVGKLLSTTSLGIYQAVYKISILPITEISRVFNQVTFPIYTSISDDLARLKKAFIKISLALCFLIIPIGTFLFVYSNEVIYIILGERWIEGVEILKILAVFGVLRALIVSVNPLFNSVKKQKYIAIISICTLMVMLFSIIPFVLEFGLAGAGYSVLLSSILSLPVVIYYIRKVF